MKKNNKYGRNPKLNPKTHCVMVRFDDEEWNKFLTMYEESEVYAKAVFLISTPSSVPSARIIIKP